MAYEPHPRCTTPPDGTEVRRFVDLAKLLDLLETEQLYFCRADLLDDPREGRLTDSERIRNRAARPDAEDRISRFESSRQDFYVNCWHSGEAESMAMWKLFGNLAIVSTIAAIKRAVTLSEAPVFIGEITYLDWNETSSIEDNAIGMMDRKSLGYGHESEVRLAIWAPLLDLSSDSAEPETARLDQSARPAIDAAKVADIMADALRAASPTFELSSDETRRICTGAIIRSGSGAKAKPRGLECAFASISRVL